MDLNILVNYLRGNQKIALLAFVSTAAMLLLISRIAFYNWGFTFLAWNLFLAWVPLLLAKFVWEQENVKAIHPILMVVYFILWLLFFPNAPYIITDLKHLRSVPPDMVWYDAIMIFTFAVAGFLTGLYSIRIIHRIIIRRWNAQFAWAMITSSMVLSGFGIFLGRFGRWNSWDIITNPNGLLHGIIQSAQNPLALKHTIVFSFVLMLLYFAFHFFAELKQNEVPGKYS